LVPIKRRWLLGLGAGSLFTPGAKPICQRGAAAQLIPRPRVALSQVWLLVFIVQTLLGLSSATRAQTIVSPFDTTYSFIDLGSVPELPTNYGGLTFSLSNSNTILIGGAANGAAGQLFSIQVVRGSDQHITGFSGTATVFADGAYNDGGLAFGPGNVLFYTRYPVNQLGQIKPGSTSVDKVIDLTAAGFTSSVGALNFVPFGFPGAGQLKIVIYNNGDWYTVALIPDGSGTFDVGTPTLNTTITGAPEGFIYVPLGSPQFAGPSLLVAEYGTGRISAYQVDSNGNPTGTPTPFITGLSGAEGAVIDPLSGDFLFSTFGGGSHVIAVRGFVAPTTPTSTPTETPTSTPTSTVTQTRTRTATGTPTATSRNTQTATLTPTNPVATNTPTNSPTKTLSATTTATQRPTNSPTASPTRTSAPTDTPSSTPSRSQTSTPTRTPQNLVTATSTPTPLASQTRTATSTETSMPFTTPTVTPTPTASATPTLTASSTRTPGQVALAGQVLVPGAGGTLGFHGQVPLANVEVDLFLCELRKPCAPVGKPVASVFTAPTGRFLILIGVDLLQGKLPVVSARVSPTLVLRAPVVVLPAGAAASHAASLHPRQVNQMNGTVIDAISEAAMRLLQAQGFENYDEAGVAAVLEAVEVANGDSNFAAMTPEAAVDQAQSTAAADPLVQMALQDNKVTATPTMTPTSATIHCVGDCGGNGEVTVDELVTMVNIALGNAPPEFCTHGVQSGVDVTVALVIQAVNNALGVCVSEQGGRQGLI